MSSWLSWYITLTIFTHCEQISCVCVISYYYCVFACKMDGRVTWRHRLYTYVTLQFSSGDLLFLDKSWGVWHRIQTLNTGLPPAMGVVGNKMRIHECRRWEGMWIILEFATSCVPVRIYMCKGGWLMMRYVVHPQQQRLPWLWHWSLLTTDKHNPGDTNLSCGLHIYRPNKLSCQGHSDQMRLFDNRSLWHIPHGPHMVRQ